MQQSFTAEKLYLWMFLQELLDKFLTFSTIKAYLAAISTCHDGFDGVMPGPHPLAMRFFRD